MLGPAGKSGPGTTHGAPGFYLQLQVLADSLCDSMLQSVKAGEQTPLSGATGRKIMPSLRSPYSLATTNRSVFQALLDARQEYGGKKVIVHDADDRPVGAPRAIR